MAEESPSAFFDKIKMLRGWRYIGRNDFDRSLGAVVQIADYTWLRIFVLTNTLKGGIVEKTFNPAIRRWEYRCVIHNKTPDQLNEYIKLTYYEQTPQ